MIYADYDYYANNYFGRAIQESEFPRFALRASQYIDYLTQNRAAKLVRACPEEDGDALTAVRMCCCALAEQYQSIDAAEALARKNLVSVQGDGPELQSETVSEWSRTYRAGGDSAQAAAKAAQEGRSVLLDTSRRYLAHTGLLYRGGGRCG